MNDVKTKPVTYLSPSNIALIKYMGKQQEGNIPVNSSFSYTLERLVSGVQLTPYPEDRWAPLEGDTWLPIQMSPTEQGRFLIFFKKLKEVFSLKNNYLVQSSNNFPKSSGVASSASSFSALTKAAYQQSLLEGNLQKKSMEELASISQKGSGSSCRSFFKPWCLWSETGVKEINLPLKTLNHQLVLLGSGEKKVSSSLAHERVRTSPYFVGRKERAHTRLEELVNCLKQDNWKDYWKRIYQIVKEEFEDMHNLFETAQESFSYRTDETHKVLKIVDQFWEEHQDGPLVTMDAGASVHLLYRLDQGSIQKLVQTRLSDFL